MTRISWWMFHVSLWGVCIFMLLDKVVYRWQLDLSGFSSAMCLWIFSLFDISITNKNTKSVSSGLSVSLCSSVRFCLMYFDALLLGTYTWSIIMSLMFWGFPCGPAGKESACNAGDPGLIPESERSPGEGIGYPLQYSWDSLVAQGTTRAWVWSLCWEDPLEEGMTTDSSILAWRIPMDRGAWWATVHGAAELDTTKRLST